MPGLRGGMVGLSHLSQIDALRTHSPGAASTPCLDFSYQYFNLSGLTTLLKRKHFFKRKLSSSIKW